MNTLNTIVRSDLLIYSVIINIVLILYFRLQNSGLNYSQKLFSKVLITITFSCALEAITLLSGEYGNSAQIPLHYLSNVLFFMAMPLPGCLGIMYMDFKIFGNEEQNKRRLFIYLIPTYISVAFTIINFFWADVLFYIDESNQYHRGFGVYAIEFFILLFLIMVLIYFFRFKQRIIGRLMQAIIIFSFIPVLGSLAQSFAIGATFSQPSHTLAALIIFLLLEKDEMTKDPLTQLYNRNHFESRIQFKLKSDEPFSVIMIDLNDFKIINDTFGHLEGDKVLNTVSKILVESTGLDDMVCRYGGDEFCLLIEYNENIAEKIISRIDNELKRYSERIGRYKVSASYGCVYVDNPSAITIEKLVEEADQNMYDDKTTRKHIL